MIPKRRIRIFAPWPRGATRALSPLLLLVVSPACSEASSTRDRSSTSDGAPATSGVGGLGSGAASSSGGRASSSDGSLASGGATSGTGANGSVSDGAGPSGGRPSDASRVAPDGANAGGADAGDSAPPPCALADSPPVTVEKDGQVVELVRIVSTSGPGIDVNGHSGVVIRNVDIRHAGGAGIRFSNADDIRIENVSIEYTDAPPSGQNPSSDMNNIDGYASARPIITHVTLRRGSTGIYLTQCPDSRLSFVEGYDFRGPFPRGQVVQWDTSDRGVLEDFSVVNGPTSWTEDNVNMYKSLDMQVRRGLVDGNNSPSGVGVIFDGGPSTGIVEDVDALHMGNGCFSDIAGGTGVIFRRTRCRDNICTSQEGRGVPLSNALMWAGHTGYTDLRIEASAYFAACNPGNIVWPTDSFAVREVIEQDFAPRAPIKNPFCWQ